MYKPKSTQWQEIKTCQDKKVFCIFVSLNTLTIWWVKGSFFSILSVLTHLLMYYHVWYNNNTMNCIMLKQDSYDSYCVWIVTCQLQVYWEDENNSENM